MTAELKGKDLTQQGRVAYANKAYKEAARLFKTAAQAYAKEGLALDAAEAANNWSVAALMAGDGQEALIAAEGTDAVFAVAGDRKRQGIAVGNLAAAHEALGNKEEAMLNYELAANLLEQAGEGELRMHALQKLSALELKSGKHISGLLSMRMGLDGVENLTPKQRFLKKLLKLPDRFL